MTDQIRRGLGGLCIAAALALVGLAALGYGIDSAGFVALFLGMLAGLASLLTLAVDLLRN